MSNSLEMNKIFAAILTAGVTFGAAGVIGRLIVHPTMPHHSAIQIGEPAPAQAVAAIAAPALPFACVFAADGRHIAFMRSVANGGEAFTQIFAVAVASRE
jgi:hypothetical protein